MGKINSLDENEIKGCANFSSEFGVKAKDAFEAYELCLNNVAVSSFGKKDTSTAHSVINALQAEVNVIADSMENVDKMLDSVINLIDNNILLKEDRLSKSITED